VIFESARCNVRREKYEKIFLPLEESALRSCPISMFVPHVEGMPHVMFERPRCIGRRDKEKKLFGLQE
jgi:hypothetical protein